MSKTAEDLRRQRPHRLSVTWCDNCRRVVNSGDEPAHRYSEQCASCLHYALAVSEDKGDRGNCNNAASSYCGRLLFPDDNCSKWTRQTSQWLQRTHDDSGIWCDRCERHIAGGPSAEHWHEEQCGGCRMFKAIDADWGYCRSHESVYSGRLMFEHDTCSQWLRGER
jgi:hypothetical protein